MQKKNEERSGSGSLLAPITTNINITSKASPTLFNKCSSPGSWQEEGWRVWSGGEGEGTVILREGVVGEGGRGFWWRWRVCWRWQSGMRRDLIGGHFLLCQKQVGRIFKWKAQSQWFHLLKWRWILNEMHCYWALWNAFLGGICWEGVVERAPKSEYGWGIHPSLELHVEKITWVRVSAWWEALVRRLVELLAVVLLVVGPVGSLWLGGGTLVIGHLKG